jgi:hypothetical protein
VPGWLKLDPQLKDVALGQYFWQLNSVGLISNAVGNRLTIAVGPNTGSHASDDFRSLGS